MGKKKKYRDNLLKMNPLRLRLSFLTLRQAHKLLLMGYAQGERLTLMPIDMVRDSGCQELV